MNPNFLDHGPLRFAATGECHPHVTPTAIVLLSGSFNPLHRGHLELAQAAASIAERPFAFELSAANVDKAPLDWKEVERRAQQFIGRADLYVTRAARFLEKARLFPGTFFAVGADTAQRIVDPHYSSGDPNQLLRTLGEIREAGCKFLVGGRIDFSQKWTSLNDLSIPAAFRDLFEEIPQELFRVDLSSTELRARV